MISVSCGMYTAVIITDVNFLDSQKGRRSSIRYSRSGQQKELKVCALFGSHQPLFTMKHNSPPLRFPERSLDLSTWNTKNLVGLIVWSGISSDNQVLVKHKMLSALFRVEPLSSCSRDCTLARSMPGSDSQFALSLNSTKMPALLSQQDR